ncbi:MAG: hypothetical protein ACOCYN_02750, partial [Planctomycetota bacterium]
MTLARRFWWALVAIAVVAAGLTGGVGWLAARSLLLRQVDVDLRRRADMLARHPIMVRQLLRRDAEDADLAVGEGLPAAPRVFALRVVGPGGRVLRSNPVWPDA